MSEPSSMSSPDSPIAPSGVTRPASPRRARVAVSLMFFTNGVLFSALLPRLPEFKTGFGLSNSEFGLLVVSFPIGALLAAALAGRAIRRFGTLPTNAAGSVLLAAMLAVAGASSVVWMFAAALVVAGAVDSVVDAAQNVHGVVTERWHGRSIMNSLHAAWSAGAATGSAIGAGAAAMQISPSVQMLAGGAAWATVAVFACRLAVVPADVQARLRTADQHGRAQHAAAGSSASLRRHAYRLLVPLVLLAVCGTLVEDVANNWAVLFLKSVAGAPSSVAGLALTVALGAQFIGRVVGDPMTDRWGRATVAGVGGLVVAAGAALLVIVPVYPVPFVGFALAGFGCATLVPAAFAAAGRVPGLPEGTGIAVLGWLMRIGFLITSPSVGALADLTSLRTAMVIPLAAGLLAALLAHRRRAAQPPGPAASAPPPPAPS